MGIPPVVQPRGEHFVHLVKTVDAHSQEVVETIEEYNTEVWTAAAESWRMLAEGDGEAAGRSQLLEPFIPRAIVEGQPPVIMYHLPAW